VREKLEYCDAHNIWLILGCYPQEKDVRFGGIISVQPATIQSMHHIDS
jgi:hypothetical protein